MSRYRIVLRGRLSERFESAFDGMALEHGPNRTVLVGDVRDQAQLYGLIGRLQEFGIELLAVEPADAPAGGSEPGAGPVASGLRCCQRSARLPVAAGGWRDGLGFEDVDVTRGPVDRVAALPLVVQAVRFARPRPHRR